VLSALKLSSRVLTLRAGKPGSVQVSVNASGPGTVTVTLMAHGSHGMRPLGTRMLTIKHKGLLRFKLGRSFAGRVLAPGSYRLVLVARSAAGKAAPKQLRVPLTVRAANRPVAALEFTGSGRPARR
jgi:hypothetical protein